MKMNPECIRASRRGKLSRTVYTNRIGGRVGELNKLTKKMPDVIIQGKPSIPEPEIPTTYPDPWWKEVEKDVVFKVMLNKQVDAIKILREHFETSVDNQEIEIGQKTYSAFGHEKTKLVIPEYSKVLADIIRRNWASFKEAYL